MGKKAKQEVITPEETMELIRQQQIMNNPNVTNTFGSTQTTFGPDGQAQITQTPSEAMMGLINQQQDFVGGGPSQLNLQRDANSDSMMNSFQNRIAQRSGFEPPMGLDQMSNLGQPTNLGMASDISKLPQMQQLQVGKPPMDMTDNAPNNGVNIGDGSERLNMMEKIKRMNAQMNGNQKSDNSLANALMQYGRK